MSPGGKILYIESAVIQCCSVMLGALRPPPRCLLTCLRHPTLLQIYQHPILLWNPCTAITVILTKSIAWLGQNGNTPHRSTVFMRIAYCGVLQTKSFEIPSKSSPYLKSYLNCSFTYHTSQLGKNTPNSFAFEFAQ